MKIKPLRAAFIVALIAVALFVGSFIVRLRLERSKIMNNCEVIWNGSEAFIKVGKQKALVSGTISQIISRQARAILSFKDDAIVDELIVWHVLSNNIVTFNGENFKSGGTMFPYKGRVYYTVGVENSIDWPAVWQWNEYLLQKLDRAEAEKIMTSFSTTEQLTSAEGWQMCRPVFTGGETFFTFRVKTNECKLILKDDSRNSSERRTIILRVNSGNQILLECDNLYHRR